MLLVQALATRSRAAKVRRMGGSWREGGKSIFPFETTWQWQPDTKRVHGERFGFPIGFGKSFLIGLAAGSFGGLVGLGGGVVMIPLMVGVAGLQQKQAHGTSLVALVFTGLVGAATYATKGQVDVLGAGLLALTATVTARFGARYAHVLPEWKLKRSFGAFLLAIAVILLARPWLRGADAHPATWVTATVLLTTGLFTGFLSGMMGVGGGSIMVPAMVLLAGFPRCSRREARSSPWSRPGRSGPTPTSGSATSCGGCSQGSSPGSWWGCSRAAPSPCGCRRWPSG